VRLPIDLISRVDARTRTTRALLRRRNTLTVPFVQLSLPHRGASGKSEAPENYEGPSVVACICCYSVGNCYHRRPTTGGVHGAILLDRYNFSSDAAGSALFDARQQVNYRRQNPQYEADRSGHRVAPLSWPVVALVLEVARLPRAELTERLSRDTRGQGSERSFAGNPGRSVSDRAFVLRPADSLRLSTAIIAPSFLSIPSEGYVRFRT